MCAFFQSGNKLQQAFFHCHLDLLAATVVFRTLQSVAENLAHGRVRADGELPSILALAILQERQHPLPDSLIPDADDGEVRIALDDDGDT